MKEVFILESNSAGGGVAAIQRATTLGFRTHFLTSQPEKYEAFPVNPMHLADQVTLIDTNDVVSLLHFFADKDPLAIMTFDDFHVLQASIVAAQKGIVHANLDGLTNARFKDRTRASTVGIGRTVRAVVLELQETTTESPIGFPCVVKPVDESGSCGVRVCSTQEEYLNSLHVIRNLAPKKSGYKRVQRVLVEEYIEGDEYSAEMVWDRMREEWVLIGFTKKHLTLPHCVEVGHSFPYSFGEVVDAKVLDVIRDWLKAMKMDNGCVHLEFKMTQDGPALMEVNPRPAGGMINELVRHVQGRSIVDWYVDMMTGQTLPQVPKASEGLVATIRFVMPSEYGVVSRVIPPAEEIAGVVATQTTSTKTQVFGGTTNDDRSIGYAIGLAHDLQTSSDLAQVFVEACTIEFV